MNNKTKNYINKSRRLLLETDLTEIEIANSLSISSAYLRKIYKTHFHIPPKKYIKLVKLKKGQTLLRTSDIQISQIAYSLGYVNVSKFSEDFKKCYGLSPSKYRKML